MGRSGGMGIRVVRWRVMTVVAVVAVLLLLLPLPLLIALYPGGAARPATGPRTDYVTDGPVLEEGPWPVFEDSGVIDMTSGHTVTVDVFYPGYDRLRDRIERDQAAPFPVIVFSPGFGSPARNYEDYLVHWASWGFVVAGASWEYEDDREEDVAYMDHGKVLALLDSMATDRRDPFYGVPDTSTCGAAGHSRGGRAAFMSSSQESRVLAVSAWMPTLNNSDEVRPSAAKLLFGGSEDMVAPPGEWQTPLFESCAEPITYIEVYGGGHSTERDLHPVLTLDLFRYHLQGDAASGERLYGDGIRGRAEGGEFRLRVKMEGEVYDSAPPAPDDPSGPEGGEPTGLGMTLASVLIIIGALLVLLRYPGHRRIVQAVRSRGRSWNTRGRER